MGERLRTIGREALLFIACAVFTGTVGLLIADTVILPNYIRKGEQIEVPEIVDLTPDQARRGLAKRGLRLRLQNPRWDTRIVKGNIVVQSPAAGSKVKSGRTIYAFPSKGRRSFKVPEVVGRKLRQAHLYIQQAGLAVGEVIEEPSDRVEEGAVTRQEPGAGHDVAALTLVTLFVSDGPPGEVITMIDLLAESVASARKRIAASGLRVGKIRYQFTTAYEPGVVIHHVPEAGEEVRQGSRISLIISKL